MTDLLATDFIAYLRNKNPVVVSVDAKNIRVEVIRDTKFDIQDRRPGIKQPAGTGSATYNIYEDHLCHPRQCHNFDTLVLIFASINLGKFIKFHHFLWRYFIFFSQ